MSNEPEVSVYEIIQILKHPETLDQQSLEYWAKRGAAVIVAQDYKIQRLEREKVQAEMAKEIAEIKVKELEEIKSIGV